MTWASCEVPDSEFALLAVPVATFSCKQVVMKLHHRTAADLVEIRINFDSPTEKLAPIFHFRSFSDDSSCVMFMAIRVSSQFTDTLRNMKVRYKTYDFSMLAFEVD